MKNRTEKLIVLLVVSFVFFTPGCNIGDSENGSGDTSGDTDSDSDSDSDSDNDSDSDSDADCASGPLLEPIAGCAPLPVPDTGDFRVDCVARINQFRWDCQCLPPLDHWIAGESCADEHAEYDVANGAHAGFIDNICSPRGWAQNECPGWGSVDSIVSGCLKMMWDEGPGSDFDAHGHYINMSSTSYTKVACGIYTTPTGSVWSVQNFE